MRTDLFDFELPPDESVRIVPMALKAVERVALSALRELVGEIQPAQDSIIGIALVKGSSTDPESIHNPHMRAHAREGQLFPQSLAAAAKTMRIPAVTMVESEVFDRAAASLGKTPVAIKLALTELGRNVGRPWSAEEKAAAAAAWITLAS